MFVETNDYKFGPNGNLDFLGALEALLDGHEVKVGSFSSDTGYSGWWNVHVLKNGIVEIWGAYTDTSEEFVGEEPKLLQRISLREYVKGFFNNYSEKYTDDLKFYLSSPDHTDEIVELLSRSKKVFGKLERLL